MSFPSGLFLEHKKTGRTIKTENTRTRKTPTRRKTLLLRLLSKYGIWVNWILPCKHFDVFEDYFGLANVLKGILEEKASGNSDFFPIYACIYFFKKAF